MEKHNLQRGSVRRLRVSGTDEQNNREDMGGRAPEWTLALPYCTLFKAPG